MNRLTATLLSTCMVLATGSSLAQDAMKQDKTTMDAIEKDGMKKDAMGKERVRCP